MAVNAQNVKFLREKTGAGIMDCKKALLESGGNFERAVKYLREKGLAEAKNRSGRKAKEGMITVSSSEDGNTLVMVEVNCETDFVSRTDKFRSFVDNTAKDLLESGIDSLENIPEKISNSVKEAAASFGENIILRKLALFKKTDSEKSVFRSYIHLGGKVGVIAEFLIDVEDHENEEVQEFTKNVALQIASMEPAGVSRDDIPREVLDEQREIFMNQARGSGKPERIVERIVTGKMEKFFSESCLLEQKYVKDGELTVGKYLKSIEGKSESSIEVKRFVRFKLGEE